MSDDVKTHIYYTILNNVHILNIKLRLVKYKAKCEQEDRAAPIFQVESTFLL